MPPDYSGPTPRKFGKYNDGYGSGPVPDPLDESPPDFYLQKVDRTEKEVAYEQALLSGLHREQD